MKDKEKQSIWKRIKEIFYIIFVEDIESGDDKEWDWKSTLKTAVLAIIGCVLTVLVVLTGVFWYISGSPLGFAKFGYTYYITTQWAMDPPAKEELFVNMLKGLTKGTHDKHTTYLNKDDMKELEMHTSSSYSGIGLLLDFSDGKTLKVGATMEGQPAEAAGLQKGDQILAIDGTPVSDIENSRRRRYVCSTHHPSQWRGTRGFH